MNIQVGDLILTKQTTIFVIDVTNHLIKGLYSNDGKIRFVGYEANLDSKFITGKWKLYKVAK